MALPDFRPYPNGHNNEPPLTLLSGRDLKGGLGVRVPAYGTPTIPCVEAVYSPSSAISSLVDIKFDLLQPDKNGTKSIRVGIDNGNLHVTREFVEGEKSIEITQDSRVYESDEVSVDVGAFTDKDVMYNVIRIRDEESYSVIILPSGIKELQMIKDGTRSIQYRVEKAMHQGARIGLCRVHTLLTFPENYSQPSYRQSTK